MRKKPPLGIMPRSAWREKRIDDIQAAIRRYLDAGLPIPIMWIAEYNMMVREEQGK